MYYVKLHTDTFNYVLLVSTLNICDAVNPLLLLNPLRLSLQFKYVSFSVSMPPRHKNTLIINIPFSFRNLTVSSSLVKANLSVICLTSIP